MFAQFPRPTLFAHRGSSAHAPENTIAAFELALTQAADAIELDVQLCGDGKVVVMHDSTVDRTTNGKGLIRDMTLASLKQLDAGAHFDSAYRGERIPTLDEVCEAVGNQLLLNIELKPDPSPKSELPLKTVQIVQRHKLVHRVIFSSFDPLALWRIKKILPSAACGILALPGFSGYPIRQWVRKLIPCEALHPHVSNVSENLTHAVHRSGQRLNVYTVNEPEDIKRMLSLEVDGIITDKPDLAKQILNSEP